MVVAPVAATLSTEALPGSAETYSALVVEDIRLVCAVLRECGFTCDRLTHLELLSAAGDFYLQRLVQANYSLLWLTVPDIGLLKRTTVGQRHLAHASRLIGWLKKASHLGMRLYISGPPSKAFWDNPILRETVSSLAMHMHNLRVCVLGEKFDKSDPRPSGSSILVCASGAFISKAHQSCKCGTHVADWWGHDHDGRRQLWRNRVTTELLTQFCRLSGL